MTCIVHGHRIFLTGYKEEFKDSAVHCRLTTDYRVKWNDSARNYVADTNG